MLRHLKTDTADRYHRVEYADFWGSESDHTLIELSTDYDPVLA